MYCGIIVEVRKALGAAFVWTTIYITAEKLATRTTQKTYAPPKRTHAIKCTFCVRKSAQNTFLSVLRGEVSTVGEHSCKNGYRHIDRRTDRQKVEKLGSKRVRQPPAFFLCTAPFL